MSTTMTGQHVPRGCITWHLAKGVPHKAWRQHRRQVEQERHDVPKSGQPISGVYASVLLSNGRKCHAMLPPITHGHSEPMAPTE